MKNLMSPSPKEPDESMYSGRVGKRIRELRERKKLTVIQLIARMESCGFSVSQGTFSQWETGGVKPNLDAIPVLAQALGVKIHELFPTS